MNRAEKAAVVDQIAAELGGSEAVYALDYRGITVPQIADLRDKLRGVDTRLRVTKNSLSERAADQAGVAGLKSLLVGPTALAFVRGDAAVAAKLLSDTARALRGPLGFKGGLLGGVLLSSEQVDALAKLPSRDVLHAQLVATVAAPLTGLARTLNALIQGIAIQLGQIRDQGLVTASAPAEPEAPAQPTGEEPATPSGEASVDPAAADPVSETDSEPSVAAALTSEAEADTEATDGSSGDEPTSDENQEKEHADD
ncbi:MAG: 50S ribosomal protein L10 [Solirubrobacteraceae bacterium]